MAMTRRPGDAERRTHQREARDDSCLTVAPNARSRRCRDRCRVGGACTTVLTRSMRSPASRARPTLGELIGRGTRGSRLLAAVEAAPHIGTHVTAREDNLPASGHTAQYVTDVQPGKTDHT